MLKIIEDGNPKCTLKVKPTEYGVKFTVEDTRDLSKFSIKLKGKKLSKLNDKLKEVHYLENTEKLDGENFVINKEDKFLELEFSEINLGFVVGTRDNDKQTGWEVIVLSYEDLEYVIDIINDKVAEIK